MANRDAVLMAVLECGTADLELLDDVEYDLGGIVEDLYGEDVKPTLNAIMERVFRKGVEELKGHLADEISHSEGAYSDDPDYEETVRLNEKLFALKLLNPEEDIGWYCNCLDTHVYFNKNEELYREYLASAVETVEGRTGFSF